MEVKEDGAAHIMVSLPVPCMGSHFFRCAYPPEGKCMNSFYLLDTPSIKSRYICLSLCISYLRILFLFIEGYLPRDP